MKDLLLINRRAHKGQFSIENIFLTIGERLRASGWVVTQYVSPHYSKGAFFRILNVAHVIAHQKAVNHIVGDVTYLAMFMDRRRLIVTIHDLNVYDRKSGVGRFLIGLLWYRIPLSKARFVTAISEFTRQEILNRFEVAPDRVRVIPNPVPAAFHFEHKRPIDREKTINILHIGTKENKNLDRTIKALDMLSPNYSIRLTIVGKPPRDADLNNVKSIEILNFWDLSLNEIVALYRQSHIVLFASTYEGFGMPILEAQAVGRPVITSNIEPMVSVSGNAALLVDPFSIEGIARGVETVISNPDLADALVDRGLRNARHYSVETVAEKYAALYREMI